MYKIFRVFDSGEEMIALTAVGVGEQTDDTSLEKEDSLRRSVGHVPLAYYICKKIKLH
jgi:hypothetical protein